MPNITSLTSSSQLIQEQQGFTLNCRATGIPKPKRFWKVNGIEKGACVRDLSSPNCFYTVDNAVYEKHNGLYTCTAQNIAGQDETSIEIDIQGMIWVPA